MIIGTALSVTGSSTGFFFRSIGRWPGHPDSRFRGGGNPPRQIPHRVPGHEGREKRPQLLHLRTPDGLIFGAPDPDSGPPQCRGPWCSPSRRYQAGAAREGRLQPPRMCPVSSRWRSSHPRSSCPRRTSPGSASSRSVPRLTDLGADSSVSSRPLPRVPVPGTARFHGSSPRS